MSNAVEQKLESESILKSQNIIYLGIAWGVLSLGFFLLSIVVPEVEDTLWYLVGTYIAECVPFVAAVGLCYRNWRSPKIASGRNVWLFLGLGTLSYFLADLIFGFWEIYWGLDPEISPADFFFLAFYLFLAAGMILAVLSRRLNLEVWQWTVLSAIAVIGITIGTWIALAEPASSTALDVVSEPNSATVVQTGSQATAIAPAQPVSPSPEEGRPVPSWVLSTENVLNQFAAPVNFSYILFDVALLIIAVTLLLAFWGGTFSLSWRMIAAAALARYLADMWFKYAATLPTEYESGGLLEVFFVFSGILFAIGAALEYDISSRPRKRRRRANRQTEVA